MPIFDFVPVIKRNSEYSAYEIGEYSYGHPTIIAHEYRDTLKIGKFCSIGEEVVIFLGGEHRTDCVSTYPLSNFFAFAAAFETVNKYGGKGPTVIGNDVWIGHGAFILNGVTIGDGAVIGARSVVAKDVAPYSVVVGNPARHVRFRFHHKVVEELLKIAWWDWPIEKIAEAAPLMCSTDIQAFVDHYKEKA